PWPAKVMASPRPPRTTATAVGVPPVSFLPWQRTRSHSRIILVSHLRAEDPFTVTSRAAAYSAREGTGDRPGGRGLAAAAAGDTVGGGGGALEVGGGAFFSPQAETAR